MDIKGKILDLLERADECACILSRPKHMATRFKNLTPGERGIAVALQEYFEAEIKKLREELSSFRHSMTTKGDSE